MHQRAWRLLFVLSAPVSVPMYLLVQAAANVVGAAFYIVVEASISRLAGRPIALSPRAQALWAVPVLLIAPAAAAAHFLFWFFGLLGRMVIAVGRWQTGVLSRRASFALGLVWLLPTGWALLTCLNAAIGLALIGMPVSGRTNLVDSRNRQRTLGELPDEMQAQRTEVIRVLRDRREAAHRDWEALARFIESDDSLFTRLNRTTQWRLADVPWFFVPGELSREGVDEVVLLLGPALFVLIVAARWPGTFAVLRGPAGRSAWMFVRVALVFGAILWLVRWRPVTDYERWYFFESDVPPAGFQWASPACWIGFDAYRWSQREWVLFNVALWMGVAGAAFAIWWLAWRVTPFLGWPRYYVAFLAARLLQRKRIAFFSVGAVTLCVAMMIIVISVMGGFVDTIRDRARGLLGDLVMDGDLRGFPYYDEFISEISQWRDTRTGEPLVVQATPIISAYGILQFPGEGTTKAVSIMGVRLNEFPRVNRFSEDLFYNRRYGTTTFEPRAQPVYGFDERDLPVLPGDMDAHYARYVASLPPEERTDEEYRYRREPFRPYPGPGEFELAEDGRPGYVGREFPGIIIGRDILFDRRPSGEYMRSGRYPLGTACRVALMPLTRTGVVAQQAPPTPALRYVDDSRTGIHEIDSMKCYVGFEFLQGMLDMGALPLESGRRAAPRCTQIQIKFIPAISASMPRLLEMKARVQEAWNRLSDTKPVDAEEAVMMSNVGVATWEEMQIRFISAIEKEKVLVLIMFGVISIVAVFLILCIFSMIVQEKTRDIGIIKSIGASAEGVAGVFLAYGGAIGLVGCVLGSLLGVVFVEHINDVQEWLVRINPNWRVWSAETYSFDKIPDHWKWSEVIWISILSIASSILGAAFPAVRAGRTWPVESLRYE